MVSPDYCCFESSQMCFWRSCLCRAGVNNIVVILMKCHVITKGKMPILHWKYLFQFACFVQKRNIKEEYASSNFKISFIAASYNQPYNIETQSPTRKEQFLSTGYLIFVALFFLCSSHSPCLLYFYHLLQPPWESKYSRTQSYSIKDDETIDNIRRF